MGLGSSSTCNNSSSLRTIAEQAICGNEPAQAAKESSPEPETISQDVQREQLMDTRRDFVANVSHELRTPVAIVKGFAETLDNDYEELSEKKRRDFIGKIRKNSDRLCFLVEDLLQLSKLESPSQKLNLAQGKLASVARTVAERTKKPNPYDWYSLKKKVFNSIR